MVEPSIINEMYRSTLPLLKLHLNIFQTMMFIDISNTIIVEITQNTLPNWVKNNHLESYVKI